MLAGGRGYGRCSAGECRTDGVVAQPQGQRNAHSEVHEASHLVVFSSSQAASLWPIMLNTPAAVPSKEAPVGDLTLIPPFVPPLRGRLIMTLSGRVELLENMIELFGGIRFRSMVGRDCY